MAHYLDTSALAKLVVAEAETDAFRAWLAQADREPVSCDLTRTELARAVRRVAPDRAVLARNVLDAVTLLAVTTSTFEAAGRLESTMLRTLDAIHIAAALELGDELDSIVTYDERMADAARANGLPVTAPN